MSFLAVVFVTVVRIALGLAVIYHLCRRDFRPVASIACALGLTWLPWLLERFFAYHLDTAGNILYFSILIMAVYLGNSLKFYDRFAWWDYAIHFMSGCLFVSVAIALADRTVSLNRLPILIFGFTLSLALHVIWEVLEYACDFFFKTNNQRWQKVGPTHNHQPEAAAQPPGLVDTMNDTLICILGTLTACVIWWFVLPV